MYAILRMFGLLSYFFVNQGRRAISLLSMAVFFNTPAESIKDIEIM